MAARKQKQMQQTYNKSRCNKHVPPCPLAVGMAPNNNNNNNNNNKKKKKKKKKQEACLKVVVLENLDQGVTQTRDFEANGDGADKFDGVDVRARVVEQPMDKV